MGQHEEPGEAQSRPCYRSTVGSGRLLSPWQVAAEEAAGHSSRWEEGFGISPF